MLRRILEVRRKTIYRRKMPGVAVYVVLVGRRLGERNDGRDQQSRWFYSLRHGIFGVVVGGCGAGASLAGAEGD